MIRLLPKISGNFRGSSKEFRSSEVSRCVWERLKKNNPLGFFPSKSVNLGLKRDLNGLFLSQIGFLSPLHITSALPHSTTCSPGHSVSFRNQPGDQAPKFEVFIPLMFFACQRTFCDLSLLVFVFSQVCFAPVICQFLTFVTHGV